VKKKKNNSIGSQQIKVWAKRVANAQVNQHLGCLARTLRDQTAENPKTAIRRGKRERSRSHQEATGAELGEESKEKKN